MINIKIFTIVTFMVLFWGKKCFSKTLNEDTAQDAMIVYLKESNYAQGKAEVVFLLDRSGSVGAADFEVEKGFVESFLTHVVIDGNATRVAVISYSDTAVRHIDYLRDPKNKCFLSQELQDVVYEDSGATNIVAAFKEAAQVLENSRPNVNKVIVLVSDGLANKGGDPVPYAAKLKNEGIEIFCFGVGRFMQTELESIASSLQHVYTCAGFKEFKRLARKIRGDPHEASWSTQESKPKCDHLCDSPYKGEVFDPGCCDPDAHCSCSLLSGMHSCVCKPGYYGLSGLSGDCAACPRGTYKPKLEPVSSCSSCPFGSTTGEIGSTKLTDCYCKEGYTGDPSAGIPCKEISCPPLQKPTNGYILGPCNTIYGSTCHFMCEEGHELVDDISAVRSCKSNGEWTGTTAICRKIICDAVLNPKQGYVKCTSNSLTVGTKCTFFCARGYIQQGSTERECTISKQWTGKATSCIPVECEIPPRLSNGYHSCRKHRKAVYEETCAYSCNYGFHLLGPRFFTCSEGGMLLNEYGTTEKPKCEDITPPEITCPHPIQVGTEAGKNFTVVRWKEPEPSDNSGIQPKMFTNPPNVMPGQRFYIGIHTFQYIAVDFAGLKSNCTVRITVVDTEPPAVLSCPFQIEKSTNYPSMKVHWEEPKFQDNSNNPLTIYESDKPGNEFEQGSRTVTYIAYDGHKNTATCEFQVIISRTSCPYHPPPINGALTCDDWLNGQMCQTYCSEKFDFVWKPADWYLCDNDAKWATIPENEPVPWPDCAKRMLPGEIRQMIEFYYSGDCNDPRVQENIKKLFMRNYYVLSKQTSMCNKRGACQVKNLNIKCGKIVPNSQNINRRKRDIWKYSENEQFQLEFDITINTNQELNDTEIVLQDFLEAIRNLNWNEQYEEELTTLSSINASSSAEVINELLELVVAEEKTTLVCKPGTVLAENICVLCPAGTFYDSTEQECLDCPIGQYQKLEGQFYCENCPNGTSTEHARTKDESLCKGVCSPGTFSKTGIETCITCPVGSYQDNTGKDACFECPKGTTTANIGATSIEECNEVCPPGSFSMNTLQPCQPCPLHHYQPFAGQTECLECLSFLSTETGGATSEISCVDLDPCLNRDHCLNNGTCFRKDRDAYCNCDVGFEGKRCERDINECLQNPCSNEGECINTEGSFLCICLDGFFGELCEEEIDECASMPCLNNGMCLDKVNEFICICLPGYEGATCETKKDLCFHEVVCLNDGTCLQGDSTNESFCLCKPGFSGIDCSYDINDCENVTCMNDGSCIDGINSFSCACSVGFEGNFCEMDIDECKTNLCFEGSTCKDLVGSYKCLCPPGRNGTYCENKMDSNFILMFPESAATIANMVSMTLNSPLSDATISMWIQTNDIERSGTPLSYAVASISTTEKDSSVMDNALTISDCSELKVYVNNEAIVTDMQIADGEWHHLAFTWSSENSGIWALYKDGILQYEGKDLRPNTTIDGGGSLIIGQEQDTVGGGFSPIETFTGNITRVNLWNSYFSKSNITRLCNLDDELPDKVLAWSDFLSGLKGDVQVFYNSTPVRD